jgi:polysaccharide biosynthesis protein PslH
MKILFVCHRFPFPPNRGGKIRPFNMIRHLSAKHEVVVGSLAHSEQELQAGSGLIGYCSEIVAEVVPERLRWTRAAGALFSTTPSSVAYFRSPELLQKVEKVSRRIVFDWIIVHCAFAAQYAIRIPATFRLMDFGDLDSGKWSDYGKWKAYPAASGYRLEASKLRRYEKDIAQQFDHCTLTTSGELEEFKKLQPIRPHTVIPNGVDLTYFQAERSLTQNKKAIVFLGRMDYFPNIDGIVYFTKEILPSIRKRIPDVELWIVGSNPTQEVRRLAAIPGILVTGHVPDVRFYLAQAAVSIAPLRVARGTQNKILESMAMGIPVVATGEAAKGIQASAPKHFLVADTPELFASEVVRILTNSVLSKSLSEAGRKRIKTVHTWAASMSILEAVLNSAASE